MSDQFASEKLDTLLKAQEKALEAAEVVKGMYPGSFTSWHDQKTLCVYSKDRKLVATIHVESVQ